MSAYIVDPQHIKELVAFAVSRIYHGPGNTSQNVPGYCMKYQGGEDKSDLDPVDLANYYAALLYNENVRSVAHRYRGDNFESLPGLIDKPREVIISNGDIINRRVKDPIHILKMCAGLEYQSCETEDYRETPACHLLDLIRGAAINQLPGYEDAPWEYRGPPAPQNFPVPVFQT